MSDTYDIAIAGGGIAGLTAALTAARLGRRTLLLAGDVPGGNLLSIEKVDGYPGFAEGVPGYELCPLTQMQAAEAGAEMVSAPLDSIEGQSPEFLLHTREGDFSARTVIIATGSDMKTLAVPGEERLKGKGVSHCASCDAPMLRDTVVAVVGGGDSALQEALTLAAHASKVVMLVRGEALIGQAHYIDRVKEASNIEVRHGVGVQEIVGEDVVKAVKLTSGEPLEVSAVFAYVGLEPNTAFLNGRLPRDANGRLNVDGTLACAEKGVFAAGSVRAGWAGRAAASAGDGAAAAMAAHRSLQGTSRAPSR